MVLRLKVSKPPPNFIRPLCVKVVPRNFQRKAEDKGDPYSERAPFYGVFFYFCRSTQRQYLLSACQSESNGHTNIKCADCKKYPYMKILQLHKLTSAYSNQGFVSKLAIFSFCFINKNKSGCFIRAEEGISNNIKKLKGIFPKQTHQLSQIMVFPSPSIL